MQKKIKFIAVCELSHSIIIIFRSFVLNKNEIKKRETDVERHFVNLTQPHSYKLLRFWQIHSFAVDHLIHYIQLYKSNYISHRKQTIKCDQLYTLSSLCIVLFEQILNFTALTLTHLLKLNTRWCSCKHF
jgi:hypothetical protein